MRVLIAETEHQIARERAEQLCMDGHQAAVALTAQAAGLRLAELPDVLVLCELDSPVQTITLLRALRAGEIPRSDSRVPVLLVGADGMTTLSAITGPGRTSLCPGRARRCSSQPRCTRLADVRPVASDRA